MGFRLVPVIFPKNCVYFLKILGFYGNFGFSCQKQFLVHPMPNFRYNGINYISMDRECHPLSNDTKLDYFKINFFQGRDPPPGGPIYTRSSHLRVCNFQHMMWDTFRYLHAKIQLVINFFRQMAIFWLISIAYKRPFSRKERLLTIPGFGPAQNREYFWAISFTSCVRSVEIQCQ